MNWHLLGRQAAGSLRDMHAGLRGEMSWVVHYMHQDGMRLLAAAVVAGAVLLRGWASR
jgi:hypothetical protein